MDYWSSLVYMSVKPTSCFPWGGNNQIGQREQKKPSGILTLYSMHAMNHSALSVILLGWLIFHIFSPRWEVVGGVGRGVG